MGWNQTIDTYHIRSCADYAGALAQFNKLPKKRGDAKRAWLHSGRQQWIDYEPSNGEVKFCLYGTSLVTYHLDGRIELSVSRYGKSSQAFVNAVCPSGVYVEGSLLTVGGRTYQHDGYREAVIRREGEAWTLLSPFRPFRVPTLDKKAANAALRASGARDFHTFAKAIVGLGNWRREDARRVPRDNLTGYIVACLKTPDQWTELLCGSSVVGYVHDGEAALKRAYTEVKRAVYGSTPGVFTIAEHDYLCGSTQIEAWRRAVKEHSYAL